MSVALVGVYVFPSIEDHMSQCFSTTYQQPNSHILPLISLILLIYEACSVLLLYSIHKKQIKFLYKVLISCLLGTNSVRVKVVFFILVF